MNTNRILEARRTVHVLATSLATILALLAAPALAEEVCFGGGPLSPCFEDRAAAEEFGRMSLLWQRSGSTGLVDEGSLSRFAMKGRDAYVRSNRTGTVLLRYPVDCRTDAQEPLLRVAYTDNGQAARVQIRLVEDSFDQFEPRTLVEFDSDLRPSSSRTQVYVMNVFPQTPEGIDTIDAANRLVCSYASYHIEVRLSRAAGGDPRLSMLSLSGTPLVESSYFD